MLARTAVVQQINGSEAVFLAPAAHSSPILRKPQRPAAIAFARARERGMKGAVSVGVCNGCGRALGASEEIVAVETGGMRRISGGDPAARCSVALYHAACYEQQHRVVSSCARCGRPAPGIHAPEYRQWLAVLGPSREVGFACPACLSERERRAASDYIQYPPDRDDRDV